MLDLEELGENPCQGGTNINLVHWTGTKFRLSFSHQKDPSDHHLISSPCSEKATNPYQWRIFGVMGGKEISVWDTYSKNQSWSKKIDKEETLFGIKWDHAEIKSGIE